ncbi:hypothetical protein PR202_gb09781 [Eleusine coracana subsp. coracana]|uniref:AAA+ ATPase domain-containing protein n=1 Tax=Eleusine coracana subsp. coracana TaxID=191504 RepID=A0AAV5EJ90_ELECO|nr:hypothetical protein PR202_gb09781 [Eleusine coracana subsp. coracana]
MALTKLDISVTRRRITHLFVLSWAGGKPNCRKQKPPAANTPDSGSVSSSPLDSREPAAAGYRRTRSPAPRDQEPFLPVGEPGMSTMLLRRRLPLLRLIRPLQAASAPYSSASGPLPALQKPPVTTSSSVELGSRLGFLNAAPLASARGESTSSSSYSTAAYLAIGAAAALGSLPVAYADANEQVWLDWALPMFEHSTGAGVVGKEAKADATEGEDLARKERKRIMELIKEKGMQRGSYPQFDVAVRGQKVVVKFKMPSTCNISHLIVDLVTHIGQEAEQLSGGSEVLVRAWDRRFVRRIQETEIEEALKRMKSGKAMGPDGIPIEEVEFIKPGTFTLKELEAVISALKIAGEKDVKSSSGKENKYTQRKGNGQRSKPIPSMDKTISDLEAMGVKVYGFDETSSVPMDGTMIWENLAGYEPQKREIEDTILLALQSPEVYDDIARGTRCKFETNRPRAVLFEGPPGESVRTGKTSSARVIAKQAGVPLLYVPLEVVMSKYYGESERLLGSVFSLANDLPDGGIIFLDEVDSFASARDSEMHEATRRILSVILRQIDGFEQDKRVVVIAATNRKEDLDPALISRFDSIICFGLPDLKTRVKIAAQYAKHLSKSELIQFSLATDEMSGRDIRDVCQQAERHWASKLIRGQVPKNEKGEPSLPPIDEYVCCADQRRKSLPDRTRRTSRSTALKLA